VFENIDRQTGKYKMKQLLSNKPPKVVTNN